MHRWRSRGAGRSKALPPTPKQKFGRAELLQMYLTIPVTSATSESTFSALRLLKNYLRSTMKQDCLNNCLLMHCHKLTTGTLYTAKVAKRFACANEQCKGHFGKFMSGYAHGWVEEQPPHVSKHSAASDMCRSKLLLPWTTRVKCSLGGTYVHREVAWHYLQSNKIIGRKLQFFKQI